MVHKLKMIPVDNHHFLQLNILFLEKYADFIWDVLFSVREGINVPARVRSLLICSWFILTILANLSSQKKSFGA